MNNALIFNKLRSNIGLIVLIILVMVSAMSVVYLKHLGRSEFITLHKLEKKRDHLNEEWGRLLLELGTWATPSRIEQQANKRLGMIVPSNDSIVILQ